MVKRNTKNEGVLFPCFDWRLGTCRRNIFVNFVILDLRSYQLLLSRLVEVEVHDPSRRIVDVELVGRCKVRLRSVLVPALAHGDLVDDG